MKITKTNLEIAADSVAIRATLSPMANQALDAISSLHQVARTPAMMSQLRDTFIYRATMADLVKVSAVSR